jgi:segregation and condensation protein B
MSDELKELDEEMTLPQIEKVETREDENKQMSMDPSIQEEEEALIAQKENDEKLCAILEGLLFLVGDEGLTIEQASQSMDISEEKVESLFDSLQKYYTEDSRGFEIERYGQKYRFLSKAFVHESAKKLFAIDKVSKLSNAALETLAIIAYKQPITRVEIEEIRGVGADVMIRKLEARGLIKEDGRSDAPGRPFLYSVTDDFMDAFKLLSLDELPDLPEFNKEEGNEDLFNQ